MEFLLKPLEMCLKVRYIYIVYISNVKLITFIDDLLIVGSRKKNTKIIKLYFNQFHCWVVSFHSFFFYKKINWNLIQFNID